MLELLMGTFLLYIGIGLFAALIHCFLLIYLINTNKEKYKDMTLYAILDSTSFCIFRWPEILVFLLVPNSSK